VRVRAVVADCLETLFGEPPGEDLLRAFDPRDAKKLERNRLLWVLAACRLLWHPAWRGSGLRQQEVSKLLVQDLATLAAVVPAEKLVDEEERREELVRRTLASSGLLLPGESRKQAEDRLSQVDSLERQRLVAAAAEKEKRIREVREKMAKKAAEEAAAKVSRE